MAYLTNYSRKCDAAGCASSASKELRSFRNETEGYYCARHGEVELKRQQAHEDAYWADKRSG